jgi:class 3 adenylate cyclase
MDVVVWLRGLGLGKYAAAFRENEIDEAVLPSLTHENLKELGVTALGHRLKLLDAIALLRADTTAPKAPPPEAPSTASKVTQETAERRQVTVMFSDLVGSTALSARIETVPLLVGHRIMGTSLLHIGEVAASRPHFDRAIALYDPLAHRPLATRFGQDLRESPLVFRSIALWQLGYSKAALTGRQPSAR